ncbi:unnamed protein product [Urochloa humidicola]
MSVLRRVSSDSSSYPPPVEAALTRAWRCRHPPRPPPVRRLVAAAWEKDFCESRGVPWRKVTDPRAGLNAEGPGGRVARWDDSAAVEALMAARRRYLAEINGSGAVPPLPDPDMYIDAVVEVGGVVDDPALEAEYEAAVRDMECAREESARLRAAMLRDDFVPVPTGWVA